MSDRIKITELLDRNKIVSLLEEGKVKLPQSEIDNILEVIEDSIGLLDQNSMQKEVVISCLSVSAGTNFEIVAKFTDNTEWFSYTGKEMPKHFYSVR